MAAVGVNYEMHLKACTGLSHASNNPFPKLRIIPSHSGRGRISSFSLTCKSHSPGANLVFPPSLPPIIISCLAKMAIGMWQFLGFAWIMETDVGFEAYRSARITSFFSCL